MGKTKQTFSAWTPVQLDEAVLAGGIGGIIGIEELSDYRLENNEIIIPKKNVVDHDLVNKNKLILSKKINCKTKKKLTTKKPNSKVQITKQNATKKPIDANVLDDINSLDSFDNGEENLYLDLLPWTSFFVPTPVAKAVVELGFKEPTEIQRLCIPPAIMGRRDILGAAETGSGKTLAFGIPIIQGILKGIENESKQSALNNEDSSSESDEEDMDNEEVGCARIVNLGMAKKSQVTAQKLWALILTPTRELAVQVKDHLVAALKYTKIKVVVVVGGMSMEKQERLLKRQPHIVVATPGRLWELISQGEPHFNNIEDIRYLAIDETDRMTEVNHFPELRSLLERINTDPAKQKLRQNFVFSATLTLVHNLPRHVKLKSKQKKKKKILVQTSDDKLKKLVDLLGITNPKIVDVTKKTGTAGLLTECSIVCSLTQKDYYLFYFLTRHPGRTLVFCNSISCVRRLASLLSILGVRPLPLHANMIQKQRLKNLERFRDSANGLLLATDVAARGLDIPHVEHVIHYQVPRTSETYVHRSGRTARANSEGLTLLLIETNEQAKYVNLMRTLNRVKELPPFPIISSLMEAVKVRVDLAREIDMTQLEYKKATGKFSWAMKAAEEMDLLLDSDQIPERVNDRATAVIKRQISAKQKQLKSLLRQSLAPRRFNKYPLLNMDTTAGVAQSAIEEVKSASKDKSEEKKRKRSAKSFKAKKKRKPLPSNNTN